MLTTRHIALLAALLLAAPAAHAQEDLMTLYNCGMNAYNAGDYPTAETCFRKARAYVPVGSANYATLIDSEASAIENQGRYAEAEQLYRQALAIRKEVLGAQHPDYASSLYSLATSLYKQGRYAEAEPLYREELELIKEILGNQHPDCAYSLNQLALTLDELSRFIEAEPLYREALAILKDAFGITHPDYEKCFRNLADNLKAQGRISEVEELDSQAFQDNSDASLNNKADSLSEQGRYAEAEPYYREVVADRKEVLGNQHPDYALSLDNLAVNLHYQGRYAEAEPLFREAMAIYNEVLGERSQSYARSLTNLARNIEVSGRTTEAEFLYRKALDIEKGLYGEDNPYYGLTLNNFASCRQNQGYYTEAETLYRQVLEILKDLVGEQPPIINNLAINLRDQGRYDEAELLFRKVIQMRGVLLGEQHPAYARSLNNLAVFLSNVGRYKEAEPLSRQALAIRKDILGERHPEYATNLNNLAGILIGQGLYFEAEPIIRQALLILKNNLGDRHALNATYLSNLAFTLEGQGRYGEAEPLYREALEINKGVLGARHPDYATSLNNLASNQYYQGHYSEAEPLFKEALAITFTHYRANQGGLSEAQRQLLYETGLGERYRWLLSRCALRPAHATPAYAWDWHLNLRGLQLQTSARLQARVATSGDADLQAAFAAWRNQREYLAALYNLTKDELAQRRVDLSAEEAKATELERDLSRRSTAFAEATDTTRITWQQVAALLKPNQGVVDIARFGQDSTAGYLVFLYRHGWEGPRTLVIPNAQWLETAGLRLYRTNVAKASPEAVVFQRFWAPIDSALGPVDKLYLAVDGVYNQLNVNTLQRSSGQYILEETEVVQVGSFRDLVLPSLRPKTPQAALVVGRPSYNLDAATFEKQFVADNANRGGITDLVGAKWSDLPGTEREARAIAEVFTGQRYRTTLLLGAKANEATVKATQQPRVLHVATHGFFVPKPEASPKGQKVSAPVVFRSGTDDFGGGAYNFDRDPLLRSGIVLAGVSNAATDKRQLKEDGVLTAYEAGTLNLQGTELVVLSACETGLGELQAGEGIYGLQRSIQLAGASSVLTSLWRVDDTATQLLMTEFYGRWLAGKTKREAFAEAQAVIRQQYPEPLYWGAFVLVGE